MAQWGEAYSDRAIKFSAVAMTELDQDSAVTHAVELLKHYGFDLGGVTAEDLVARWSRDYPVNWLRSAVIEALYQGRYKAFSVEQILILWRRRTQPIHHFNHEFERIICSQFPKYRSILTALDPTAGRSPLPPTSSQTGSAVSSEADSAAQSSSLEATSEKIKPEAINVVPTNPSLPVLKPLNSDADSTERSPTIESISELRQGELPIQTFQPRGSLEIASTEWRTGWSRTDAVKHPIHQFIPTEESPEFYSKLKAVAQQDLAEAHSPSVTSTVERQTSS